MAQLLHLIVNLLTVAGIVNCRVRWYPILVYILYFFIMLAQLFALYTYWGNLDATVENIILTLAYMMCYGQAAYCILHRSTIQHLFLYLENKIQEAHDKESQEILQAAKIHSNKLTWFLIITTSSVAIPWALTPFIMYYTQTDKRESKSEDNEPFPFFCIMMALPFDATTSPTYEIVFFIQAITQTMAAVYNMGVCSLVIATIVHTAAHFSVLAKMISKLSNPDEISNSEAYLDRCIHQHQEILKFTQDLGKFLSPLLFMFFRTMEILICVTVFQLVLTLGKDDNTFKYLMACMVALFLPYTMCLYGEHIKQQSILVEKEACSCLWYTKSTRFKRHLLLLIMQAQRPVQLRVGIFYTMTMDTFAKMLNTAYSYFTLLQQLNE